MSFTRTTTSASMSNFDRKFKRSQTIFSIFFGFVAFCIVATIAMNIYGVATGNSNITFGMNGAVETRCISGMQFTIDQTGHTRQIMDEFGKGLRCN